jgi:hypothetical protein
LFHCHAWLHGNHAYSQHELGYLNWLRPGYTHLLSAAAPPKYVTWIYGQIAEQIAGGFALDSFIIHHLVEGMSMIMTPEFVCWNSVFLVICHRGGEMNWGCRLSNQPHCGWQTWSGINQLTA